MADQSRRYRFVDTLCKSRQVGASLVWDRATLRLSAKALAEATTFRSECTVLFADKSAPTGNPLHLRSSEASPGPLPPEVREMGLYLQDLCITLSAYPRHEHQPQNHPIIQ
ncbi:Predicted acylesterase/phospholipase RssA [Pseudomonas syringae pv. actinidiae]|uniref:Predicted acylesterase/phospholipase RssA n=1 Tax=Pseudomonas syringae pv. actinidiae TaxID=103796 RepID=A0AAN4TJA9_PSESF|nr:Predicted acylesterase/phospholipase RssA [Pseudomonas syringae pv. actinidiae]